MSKKFIDKVLSRNKNTLLSKKDQERLLSFIEEGQIRIEDAKRFLLENSKDFDIWYRLQENKKIYNINSLKFKNTILNSFISENDILVKRCVDDGLDYKTVYEVMCFKLKHSKLTQEDFNLLTECMMKLNFGGVGD